MRTNLQSKRGASKFGAVKFFRRENIVEIRHYIKQPSILIPLGYVLALIVLALVADIIAPYHYAVGDPLNRLSPPSSKHLLGTDHLGRDVLSRIIYGTRPLLFVIVAVLGIAIPVGVSIGILSGYYGGFADLVVSRVIDMFMVFPAILIALFLVAVFGPGLDRVVLAIAITEVPVFARLTRALVVVEKENLYVEACKALGAGPFYIISKHVLPNIRGPLLVQATFSAATAILWEAALSFLGLGVQPPTPSWGLMMYEARRYFRTHPYLMIWPGIAIFVTVFMLNMLGEKLRDILDPRFKQIMRPI